MFCERCGSRIEEGALACSYCGAERTSLPREERRASFVEPQQDVLPGPKCLDHPGMPLLGKCPRCGRDVCVRCAPDAVEDRLTCTRCIGLTEAHPHAPPGSVCATHPQNAAAFICTRCGNFACTECRATSYGSEGRCVRCQVSVGPLASRGARFGANLIDNLVVFLPAGVVGFLAAVLRERDAEGLFLVGGLLGLFAGAGAELVAQIAWNQSLGKRLFGIQVVRLDGQPAEVWRVLLLRNLVVHVIAQLCGLFALIDALAIFSDDQRCLHDHIAGTRVVEKSATG